MEHRITKIADNSLRLANGEPLHPALSGTDEISRLDKDFHKMADALTEAARKERAVVDNALDLICSLDAEGVFRMVNPAAEKILGRKPAELVGSSYLDLVLSADKERTRTMLKSLMSGEMTEPFEHSVLNNDGSTVDLVLSAHWSETDESLFCVMHDITLHRQTQRLKQELTNLISDGLKVPLLSTQETLKLLASGAWDEQTGINRVLDAAHQIKPMLKLLSNLLEVEKFDASMLSLDLNSLEISTPINEAISAVQHEAAEKEVTFDVHSDSALVEADRLRMVQALANLLSHAIDVSPAGSSVKVRCRADKQSVRIEITDSGASLSAAEQSLIFEPLRRDLTGKDRIGGTRLGLVISKSIVEAHHGTIGIWDAKPMGSTFWIQIPAQI